MDPVFVHYETDEELDAAAEAIVAAMDLAMPPPPERVEETGGLILGEAYNPHQARVPAGSSRGGQFASGGRGGSVLARAQAAEPGVTGSMQAAAGAANGELVGLEYRVKGAESLERKIQGYQDERGLTREQAELEVNDALRYTIQMSNVGYAQGYMNAQTSLSQAGHTRLRTRQYWANPDQTGYVGINEVWQTSSGQKFEVQFHTAQTFALKQQSHVFYEAYRVSTNPAQRQSIMQDMQSAWASVNIPPGSRLIT